MSDLCRYCGVVSRSACSTYKRRYLEEELAKCPNLYPDQRAGALHSAGFTERARLMYELQDLREENARLRRG
jgi:hypothetical protein